MKKKRFYTEASYAIGIVLLSLATALTEAADFGVSMVVAPAYLLHLKLSETFPFFSFGMAEYTLQAFLIAALAVILKKFKLSYLFSFITALIYGILLDFFMKIISFMPTEHIATRILLIILGIVICSFSVSLLFRTYIPPEAYELFVKEVSSKFGVKISKFKLGYDCISCVVGIILSFIFFGFGNFVGVNIGTVICAVCNGPLIGFFGKILDKNFDFTDRLNLRKLFEK